MVPAAGHRNATGALTTVGTEGLLWASSSYSAGNTNASFFGFTAGNVRPQTTGNRAAALAVRCVQHLRLLSSDRHSAIRTHGPQRRKRQGFGCRFSV